MSEPLVFVSRHRVKPGKLDLLKALTREIWATLEAEKPRTLVNLAYLSEDGTEVRFVHAFADVEAMQLHMQGADDRTAQAYELIEPIGFEIYGPAEEHIVKGMRAEAAVRGATLQVWPNFVAGFLRLAPA